MAKCASNASGAMLLPSLIQVTESISGSVVPLAMFFTNLTILAIYGDSEKSGNSCEYGDLHEYGDAGESCDSIKSCFFLVILVIFD